MQDWILTHTIRNHVPAWTEIVIPCPCQGHQPRGTPPGPHPPGGAPVLTDPTIFIHLIYAITLTNTYFTHHLCYRRYVNYCIHYIPIKKKIYSWYNHRMCNLHSHYSPNPSILVLRLFPHYRKLTLIVRPLRKLK